MYGDNFVCRTGATPSECPDAHSRRKYKQIPVRQIVPRAQIDEPKTPYTEYECNSDGESVSSGRHLRSPDENHPKNRGAPDITTQWGDISSRLQAVADRRDGLPSSPAPSWNASDGEDEKKKAFKDMRKKHYNEAEEIKRWQAEHADDDDDDEDDDSD